MRIQIIVDDALGQELKAMAKNLGLSVSAYVRCLIKYSLSESNVPKINKLDIAMQEIIDSKT
jgi:hypothetical protein